MIPLWTTARELAQSAWGCEFATEGLPWVAHRVCPRLIRPRGGMRSSWTERPASYRARAESKAPPRDDEPAEHSPYSRRRRPSKRPGSRYPDQVPTITMGRAAPSYRSVRAYQASLSAKRGRSSSHGGPGHSQGDVVLVSLTNSVVTAQVKPAARTSSTPPACSRPARRWDRRMLAGRHHRSLDRTP